MTSPIQPDRRRFLQTAAASAALPLGAGFHPGGDDVLRVGLIGCGGRGTGAAVQALRADPGARLVAMGDAFEDRLNQSLQGLWGQDVKDRVQVAPEHRFTGFDAGKKVIESGIDVVLLAEPPHFRPHHLELAIDKGLHVFCEKPVAVDGPGIRRILESCRKAKEKKLSVVSGLCYRYDLAKREVINKIREGAIGDIVAMQCTYNTGTLWHRGENPEWSDMEYQMRNWLYYTWLSGDMIAEQHIHSIDKCAWAMNDVPAVAAVSLGGRQVRTEEKYGHVYDHFATVFEYENGVKMFSYCRQQAGAHMDVSDHVMGTKGTAHIQHHRISGENPWRWKGRAKNMYQQEHDELFAAIRSGEPINNGEYMCNSTLLTIMGRMAAYTGQRVTWDMALNSKEVLGPKQYAWGDNPVDEIAMPGLTSFG